MRGVKALRGAFLVLATAFVLTIGGGFAVVNSQDITDPVTTSLLPNDMITVVRNGHQRLAAPLYLTSVGSLDQPLKCTMVSATTCTATLVNQYVAIPICLAEDQTGFIVAHATAPAASSTVTVTAASSQSDTFVVICEPNPN